MSHMNRDKWDQLADEFENTVCDITQNDRDSVIDRLVAKLPLGENSVLVDLGCGIGTFILRYGSRFTKVIGSDFSSRILARAKTKCKAVKNASWIVADLPDAAKEIGSRADLTVCMNVITSIDASQRKKQWAALKRVTKPGGRALIVIPSLESAKKIARVEEEINRSEQVEHDQTNGLMARSGDFQKHYSRKELREILAENGFVTHAIKQVYYPWAEEGHEESLAAEHGNPWDWICYVERPARVVENKKPQLKANKSRRQVTTR